MRIRIWLFPFLLLLSLLLHSMAYNEAECDALLQFSNSYTISRYTSEAYYDKYPSSNTSYLKTASWKNGTDCCLWDGVTCHKSKNFVIGLDLSDSWLGGPLDSNSTLFSLLNLRRLNLAGNDFMGSRISPRFGTFMGMAYLNLSASGFSGPIPLEMTSHLSNLATLDLSSNSGNDGPLTIDDHSFRWLIQNLTQLRELALDRVDMSRISAISLTNISSSLTSLSLRGCDLRGIFPTDIFHLPNLCSLSLKENSALVGTLPDTNWTSPLVSLDLSDTEFHGPIPALLGNLTSMNSLDLSYSKFTGEVPPSLGNLHHLTHLALDHNNLGGTVNFETFARLKNLQALSLGWNNLTVLLQSEGNCSFPSLRFLELFGCNLTEFPYFLGSSTELFALQLSGNMISGQIPEWFWQVGRATLGFLDLSSNNLTGEISSSICQVNSLYHLSLSNNRLNGTIPVCLGNLSGLLYLDLNQNLLQGPLPRSLANCTNLLILFVRGNKFHGVIKVPLSQQLLCLDFSNNNFSGVIPSSICQLSSLRILFLSNNSLSGTIPRCLANCTSLQSLYAGNNEIYDTFPGWLINANGSLDSLDLQSNRFHGSIGDPLPQQFSFLGLSNNNFSGQLPINFLLNSTVSFIDMANNCFDGPLPIPPPKVKYFLLSNNKFHGDIPHEMCNATGLDVIDLSNNRLTGTIPRCFINFNATLRTIRLSQNQLGGTLPQSLAHYENLEVLDLSENELEGSFPYWLDTLPNLQVLALRSNRFHGPVDGSSITHRPFPKLRIFDLSENNFCGPLPAKYLANLIAMKNEQSGGLQYMGKEYFYQDSVMVEMKGLEIELVKILTTFMTIDFSSNFFEGEIPEVIGDLKALKGLNFSHNNLSGNIPSSSRNLTNLEWLDLSSNKLNGKIPRGLADLVWLSCLNLSDNQLVGPIPQSTQFSTFSHSFDGNPGLCGRPLPKACGNNTRQGQPSTSHEEEESESDNWIEWRAVPMGYACGLAFGISAGYIMLETGRPRWLARMVEQIGSRKTNRPRQNVSRRNFSRSSPRGQ